MHCSHRKTSVFVCKLPSNSLSSKFSSKETLPLQELRCAIFGELADIVVVVVSWTLGFGFIDHAEDLFLC